jgi:hypothetical protein
VLTASTDVCQLLQMPVGLHLLLFLLLTPPLQTCHAEYVCCCYRLQIRDQQLTKSQNLCCSSQPPFEKGCQVSNKLLMIVFFNAALVNGQQGVLAYQ